MKNMWASLTWKTLGIRLRVGDRRLAFLASSALVALIVVGTIGLTLGEIVHFRASPTVRAHQLVQATAPLATPTRAGVPHSVALVLSTNSEVLTWAACEGNSALCSAESSRGFNPTSAVAIIWVCQENTGQTLSNPTIDLEIFGNSTAPATQLTEYCPQSSATQSSGVVIENYPPGFYTLVITKASTPSWFVLVVQVAV